MTPALKTDIWRPATQAEIIQCLALLAVLPSRAADSPDVDKGAYYIALKGVTWHGLSEAARDILRGSLRHTFFPSPVEIRQQHDTVMSWHVQEQRRIENLQAQAQERRRIDEVDAHRTPESRARVDATYKAFCSGYADKKKPVERVYLDPELVAQIPDAPTTIKRAGGRR